MTTTYTCHCQREGISPFLEVVPAGWELRTVRKYDGGSYDVPLCPDCVAFENSLSPAEVDVLERRTHGISSAVDDEPQAFVKALPNAPAKTPSAAANTRNTRRLWQARLTFHTDKGAVESTVIIGADNSVQAIKTVLATVDALRRTDLVSIQITPAPLERLGPIMSGGGLDACNTALSSPAASPADRVMRPKRQVWPNMGMHG